MLKRIMFFALILVITVGMSTALAFATSEKRFGK